MEVLRYLIEKLSGELGKLLASALVEHTVLTYLAVLLAPLGASYVMIKRGSSPLSVALMNFVAYFLLYLIVNKGKKFVAKNISSECDLEPCSSKWGIPCFKLRRDYALKCLQRLEGELGIKANVKNIKCIIIKRENVVNKLLKALEKLREGDKESAREELSEITICS